MKGERKETTMIRRTEGEKSVAGRGKEWSRRWQGKRKETDADKENRSGKDDSRNRNGMDMTKVGRKKGKKR